MQTTCQREMNRSNVYARLTVAIAARRLPLKVRMAFKTFPKRLVPMIATASVAAAGRPSPTLAFALALALELGATTVRLPLVSAGIAAFARVVALAITALTFYIAADRGHQFSGVVRSVEKTYGDAQKLSEVVQNLRRPFLYGASWHGAHRRLFSQNSSVSLFRGYPCALRGDQTVGERRLVENEGPAR
jgi:hypothetical protein